MTQDNTPAPGDRSPWEDRSAPFYTIGQVSELLGLTPAALRRLEAEDVVTPERSGGGQRRYSRDEVELLRQVKELADEGITLPGVRKVLELRQQVGELEDEIATLRQERSETDT
ncbi:MerR family transcriptional regulator [Aeromicrobium camelliae]|uniref:MerR family transcriptional regulator n=1 Tax=Aeromicrobium camelliae TaxID=1538144 RepID=A0A3N6WN15_9ACTN|nr:MerR family transcriptional regulator [Aeromicrobium camelliae]RQN08710.1 MerR family transcriptional regulator [Aeromicrobium camelliae]